MSQLCDRSNAAYNFHDNNPRPDDHKDSSDGNAKYGLSEVVAVFAHGEMDDGQASRWHSMSQSVLAERHYLHIGSWTSECSGW